MAHRAVRVPEELWGQLPSAIGKRLAKVRKVATRVLVGDSIDDEGEHILSIMGKVGGTRYAFFYRRLPPTERFPVRDWKVDTAWVAEPKQGIEIVSVSEAEKRMKDAT